MTREDMLAKTKALREEMLKDNGETWEENFLLAMLDACVARLDRRTCLVDKALHLSLVGERFKTWMDMGWTRWDEYPHPCVSDLHLRLNDLTEAAWHVHCRREDF